MRCSRGGTVLVILPILPNAAHTDDAAGRIITLGGNTQETAHMTTIRQILTRLTFCLLALPSVAVAQEATAPLRLERAVELAVQNYPAIRTARAQASAAGANIELAQNAYLPRVELNWQQTRATRNNINGTYFSQPGIQPITGSVLPSSFTKSAWGSGGGLLLAWELFDFGLRKAGVELARHVSGEAAAKIGVTRLDVAASAADAFLRVAAADQAVRAAQANVERLEIFSQAVHVLADNQLRPGADASRTDAELAAARSVLIQAKQNAAIVRVALAEAMGQAGQPVAIEAGPLLELPPSPSATANTDLSTHPLAVVQKASLGIVLARQRVLDRSFFPRLSWQTAVFGRGSGANADGRLVDDRGYFPDTPNWITGLTISFAPTDIFNLRTLRRQESDYLAAQQARYDETLQKLTAEEASARVFIASAKELAENTPRQLQAAQETDLRVRKRYEAELTTVTEVAETLRLLAQAEVENALARLSVWRAHLAEAKAKGDLTPFLDLLRIARR
jgi:outer membrane protein